MKIRRDGYRRGKKNINVILKFNDVRDSVVDFCLIIVCLFVNLFVVLKFRDRGFLIDDRRWYIELFYGFM